MKAILGDVVIECYEERIVEVVVKSCDVLCGSESQVLQKHTFLKNSSNEYLLAAVYLPSTEKILDALY